MCIHILNRCFTHLLQHRLLFCFWAYFAAILRWFLLFRASVVSLCLLEICCVLQKRFVISAYRNCVTVIAISGFSRLCQVTPWSRRHRRAIGQCGMVVHRQPRASWCLVKWRRRRQGHRTGRLQSTPLRSPTQAVTARSEEWQVTDGQSSATSRVTVLKSVEAVKRPTTVRYDWFIFVRRSLVSEAAERLLHQHWWSVAS